MLTTYFKNPLTLAHYSSGIAGLYLDDLIGWLKNQGYCRTTIRRHIREINHFTAWAKSEKLTTHDLDRGVLNKFHCHLEKRGALRYPSGAHHHTYQSARVFINFLENVGIVERLDPAALPKPPILFLEFRDWMRIQRGTLDSTIDNYRLPIIDLLQRLEEGPSTFTAQNLRECLLQYVGYSSREKSKNWATAVRMFLRFLIAKGICNADLEHAIPTVARWRLSSLPKYIPIQDVESLINSCDQACPIGIRDQAILLLLARLGLRASDVSGMKFSNIDWSGGALIVSGKNRCETRLPLPQEVGEAILHYLQNGRPPVANKHVFITSIAPFVPITRQVVSRAVTRAIRRTGINAPSQGAHLLRHSVATGMLRQGISLPAVGELLRHASIETTTIYAKVNVNLLQEVAMSWPEVPSC